MPANCEELRYLLLSSREKGFISLVTEVFPELLLLTIAMNKGVRVSFQEAKQNFDASCALLRTGCSCGICKSEEHKKYYVEERFCCAVLLESLFVILRSLSGIPLDATLCPMRSGLEAMYHHQRKLKDRKITDEAVLWYGPVALTLECPFISLGRFFPEDLAVQRMLVAAQIFAGRHIKGVQWDVSAMCVAGICIYSDVYKELSGDLDSITRCHVIPGQIQMHGRVFDRIEDLGYHAFEAMRLRGRGEVRSALVPLTSPDEVLDTYNDIAILVKERTDTLQVGFLLAAFRLLAYFSLPQSYR